MENKIIIGIVVLALVLIIANSNSNSNLNTKNVDNNMCQNQANYFGYTNYVTNGGLNNCFNTAKSNCVNGVKKYDDFLNCCYWSCK